MCLCLCAFLCVDLTSRKHSKNIPTTSRKQPQNIPKACQTHSKNIPNTFQIRPQIIPKSSQQHTKIIPKSSPTFSWLRGSLERLNESETARKCSCDRSTTRPRQPENAPVRFGFITKADLTFHQNVFDENSFFFIFAPFHPKHTTVTKPTTFSIFSFQNTQLSSN